MDRPRCAALALALAGCGADPADLDDASPDDVADVASDLARDVPRDVAPDAAPTPDRTAPDAAPDAPALDASPDVAPDVATDVAPADVAPDRPDAPALRFEDTELSYGELDRRANQLARRLQALGVGVETRVGLCVRRSPSLVIGLLAILKAGGAYVPLDPTYPSVCRPPANWASITRCSARSCRRRPTRNQPGWAGPN